MSSKSTKLPEIRARFDFKSGCLLFDRDHEVVRTHRLNRIFIEPRVLSSAFTKGFSTQYPRDFNEKRTKVEVTVIINEDRNEVKIAAHIKGVGRSELPEGIALAFNSVQEIADYLDNKEVCWPLADRTFQTMRDAFDRGNAAEIGIVQGGLHDRLWHLEAYANCKHPALQDKIAEMIAVMDACIETALRFDDADKAIALAERFTAAGMEAVAETDKLVLEARERLAAEKERKARSVATLADVLMEKERQEAARQERHAKRSKSSVANFRAPAKNDEVPATSAETESIETGGQETDESTAEGSPETAPTSDATHRTPRQERIFAQSAAKLASDTPAPEAPKPTETETKKAQPTVARDLKAQLAAKVAGLKSAAPVTTDAAPATESIETK